MIEAEKALAMEALRLLNGAGIRVQQFVDYKEYDEDNYVGTRHYVWRAGVAVDIEDVFDAQAEWEE